MNLVVLCSAFLVLLYALLSVNVSRIRLQSHGSLRQKEAHLTQAVRAHGNAAEYIPLIVAVLLYLDHAAPSQLLSITAVAAAASRVLHVGAMLWASSVPLRQKLRFAGAVGTYVSLLALGFALARHAVA